MITGHWLREYIGDQLTEADVALPFAAEGIETTRRAEKVAGGDLGQARAGKRFQQTVFMVRTL
jgi:hypothetical protein